MLVTVSRVAALSVAGLWYCLCRIVCSLIRFNAVSATDRRQCSAPSVVIYRTVLCYVNLIPYSSCDTNRLTVGRLVGRPIGNVVVFLGWPILSWYVFRILYTIKLLHLRGVRGI